MALLFSIFLLFTGEAIVHQQSGLGSGPALNHYGTRQGQPFLAEVQEERKATEDPEATWGARLKGTMARDSKGRIRLLMKVVGTPLEFGYILEPDKLTVFDMISTTYFTMDMPSPVFYTLYAVTWVKVKLWAGRNDLRAVLGLQVFLTRFDERLSR